MYFNQIKSLTSKEQMTKFSSSVFKNVKAKLYHTENSKIRGQNSVDLDEVAHNEPPHQDLHCLPIQLFFSLVLKESSMMHTHFIVT